MNAPICPVTRSQPPPGSTPGTGPTLLPAIPVATDLPSLIRAINIMRDIIRNITTSLTINNTYLPGSPRQPSIPPPKHYTISPYPDWYQVGIDTTKGFVFYKAKGQAPDNDQRAYILRTDAVGFRNRSLDNGESFLWRYSRALDSQDGDSGGVDIFKEDFFERVVNVSWGTGLAVEFGDGAGGPPR